MSQITTVPGAGNLRGSEFLLFSDWKLLGDQPGLNLTEQTNKARDICIKICVLIEDNKEATAQDKADADSLKDMLCNLMEDHFDFDNIDGSQDWKNAYWIQLTNLFYHLFRTQHRLELIETSAQERMGVPDR